MNAPWKTAAFGALIGLILGLGWLWFRPQAGPDTIIYRIEQRDDGLSYGVAPAPTATPGGHDSHSPAAVHSPAKPAAAKITRDLVLQEMALFRLESDDLAGAIESTRKIADEKVKAETLIRMLDYFSKADRWNVVFDEASAQPLLKEIRDLKDKEERALALGTYINTLASIARHNAPAPAPAGVSPQANARDRATVTFVSQAVPEGASPRPVPVTAEYARATIKAIWDTDLRDTEPLLKSAVLLEVASGLQQTGDDLQWKTAANEAQELAAAAPVVGPSIAARAGEWLHSLPLGMGLLCGVVGWAWPHFQHGVFVALGETFIHGMHKSSHVLQSTIKDAVASGISELRLPRPGGELIPATTAAAVTTAVTTVAADPPAH